MNLCLRRVKFLLSLLAAFFTSEGLSGEQFEFHREHVLGTSMQWIVEGTDRAVAETSEDWALQEIERLEKIFSRHQPDSELNRLADSLDRKLSISAELAQVLQKSEGLRLLTDGAFDIRANVFRQFTEAREDDSDEISLERRRGLIAGLQRPPFELQHLDLKGWQLTVLDWPPEGWTLDAIAKGAIMDWVATRAVERFAGLSGVVINIGGDLRIVGQLSTSVSIENPFHAAESTAPLITWKQAGSVGIATSGGYRRFSVEDNKRSSHLIDPRSRLPVKQVVSVTVLAPSAMEADGLATSVSVLGVQPGLALVEGSDSCECFIVDAEGNVYRSSGWPIETRKEEAQIPRSWVSTRLDSAKNDSSDSTRLTKIAIDKPRGLHVSFELSRPKGAAYRRPYLALWLEDEDGFPVKTALLWLQTQQPGPRWHRDLTRWYRNDRLRKTAETSELIGVVSGATRGPGQYEAHFDGTDNQGEVLQPGKYTLFLEVAREHGTYQLIRVPITWGEQPIARTEVEGNVEVRSFAYEFLPTNEP